MQGSTGAIRSAVGAGVRRQRASRALQRVFALGIPAAMLLAVVFLADHFRPLHAEGIQWALAAAVALPLAGLLWGILQPVDPRRVATAIDKANGLHDRLGIAWGLTSGLTREPPAGFGEAAVRDAARHVPNAQASAAFPLSPPNTWRALLLALVAAAVALWIRAPEPPRRPGLLPRVAAPLGDPEELAEERAEVAALKEEAAELQDERLGAVAEQLAKLVDAVDAGELDLKRAFERIRGLENSLKEGAAKEDLEVKAVQAAMKEAAKELKKAAGKDKQAAQETQELAEALDKGDLEKARQELERLSKLLENPLVPRSLLKKLAKAFKSSAKELQDKFDARMKKELASELDKLKKLMRKQGLSEREEQRKKELEKQLAQRSKGGEPPKQRQTNSLSSPERNPENPGEKQRSADKDKARDKDADDKAKEAQTKANGKQGMSRSVSRLSRRMKKAGEQMDKGQQQAQEQASEEMRRGAQDIKSMHRAMRRQKARQQAQRRVSRLKESLRKSQKGGQRQQRAQAQRRSFRRKGAPGAGKPNKPGGKGQGHAREGGRKEGELKRKGRDKGPTGGAGNEPGDDKLGRAERLKSKRKDQFVRGQELGGPMDQEVILSAAKKGFAKTGYRDVFTKYRDVAEEELATDRVPAGYRRYVYRYFDLIRPAQGAAGGDAGDGGER